jgi:hypothetical protein
MKEIRETLEKYDKAIELYRETFGELSGENVAYKLLAQDKAEQELSALIERECNNASKRR